MPQPYVFDQAWSEERARLAGIEAIWDPGSQRLIRDLEIGGGARILEVGGGGGALVEWLADLVGEDGRVVATDVDPRFLLAIERPNVEVHHHDIVSDAVPDGPFDLVHARLVLEHLPERLKVLDKLVAVLAPGGALLVEDYDWGAHEVHPSSDALVQLIAAVGRFMEGRGYDRFFGRALVGELARRLSAVRADGRLALVEVSSPGAAAFTLSLEQLGPVMVERGELTSGELEAARNALDEPGRLIITPAMIAVWGRAT